MKATLRAFLSVSLISISISFLVSCGDITAGPSSTSVGAACTADNQCQQQCLVDDSRFPGGMCTVPCQRDADCPGGSACIAHNGGVCVVTCHGDADCAAFGRGFACAVDSRETGGDVMICRVP